MSSDDERRLFEMWGWEYDSVQRIWIAPEHWHQIIDGALACSRPAPPATCRVMIEIDVLSALMQSPEAEGKLVGLVMSHGVRHR